MAGFGRTWLLLSLFVSLFFQVGVSLVFKDIPPSNVSPKIHETRDYDLKLLDILNRDSFFWSGAQNGHMSLANFTVDLPGDDESIISMEKFQHMLKSVECTADAMTLTVKGDPFYDYIKRAWQWVNDADPRRLVVVAGAGACGSNPTRLPFSTGSIVFNDVANTVKLIGKAVAWKEFQNYELTVGKYQPVSDSDKRDLDKSLSLDFNHDMPFNKFKFPISSELDVILECVECRTTGSFDFGFHIKTSWGIPDDASISLKPNGIGAKIAPRIGISGNLTGDISDEKEIATIPIGGISIPGDILDVGPEIAFSIGWAMGPVAGEAYVSSGVDVSVPDSAELEIQLTPPDISASGWAPSVQTIPVVVDAKLIAKLNIYLKAEVQLSAEVLGQGFEVGVDIKPYVGGSFSVEESSDGVCKGDEDIFGVKVTPALGVSLNANVAKASDPEDPLAEVEIAKFAASLPEACFPFGPGGEPENSPSSSAGTPTSTPIPNDPTTPTATTIPSTSPSSPTPSPSAYANRRRRYPPFSVH